MDNGALPPVSKPMVYGYKSDVKISKRLINFISELGNNNNVIEWIPTKLEIGSKSVTTDV